MITNKDESRFFTIRAVLRHNVPRYIAHILARGGVSDTEWDWLLCEDESPNYLEGVLARADEYLLYPNTKEIFDKGMFVLILGITIMSFFPGGVRFFGLRFCSDIENFVDDEIEA